MFNTRLFVIMISAIMILLPSLERKEQTPEQSHCNKDSSVSCVYSMKIRRLKGGYDTIQEQDKPTYGT
jgi:hypothetical protein